MKIAFVVSEFNSEVTAPMEQRARRHAESLGVEVARVVHVPGVYDMGPVVKALLQRKEIDGVVMIGAVIKGDTRSRRADRACDRRRRHPALDRV